MRIIEDFRDRLRKLDKDQLWEMLKEQDPEIYKQAKRIEWVFANKLSHLIDQTTNEPITSRPITKEELVLLIDPVFEVNEELVEMGFSEDQQREAFIASDSVLWAKTYLSKPNKPYKPRAYQILMMRHPNNRKVMRLGRRAGKTHCMALMLLHYAYTTTNGRCLVMAPMKTQVALIHEEVNRITEDTVVETSFTKNVKSPQHEIQFANGSTVRMFTTGMKSSGKSDVARGQEAHFIVLDEMDYMSEDDFDALLAMLQKTDENQPTKTLVGASTPTGKRGQFFKWCTGDRYTEFYFPSYCAPFWTQTDEDEFREEYSTNGYRHEIEADWGDNEEGVYPKRYVDAATQFDWGYVPRRTARDSEYLLGVDWDKYAAGPNLCVLEVCGEDQGNPMMVGKLRIAHREEIPRSEFVLSQTVDKIIRLDEKFEFKHIYVDRGYGDMQVEMLKQYGMQKEGSDFHKRVRGVSFGESVDVTDPATREDIKKRMKPFMVEGLRGLLEENRLFFPSSDEELYKQLTHYVVKSKTDAGTIRFEMSDEKLGDHAHDALLLASLAFIENYEELLKMKFVRHAKSFVREQLENYDKAEREFVEEDKEKPVYAVGYSSRKRTPRRKTNTIKRRKIGKPVNRSRARF